MSDKQPTYEEAYANLSRIAGVFGVSPPARSGLDGYVDGQIKDALAFLDLDTSYETGWKWKTLESVIGPQLQQELLIVAARPANGKTTFALNHTQYWVESGRRVLYIGMEMTADLLRARYAAWDGDFEWKHVARRRWDLLPSRAKDEIRKHLEFQRTALRDRLFFAPDERLTVTALGDYLKELEDKYGGVDMVVIDHLHRMGFGGGDNLTGLMSEAVTGLKSLAVSHNTRMFVNAQLKRHAASDVVNDYLPAGADAIKQTGAAEQEADSVLTLNRGMKVGVTNAVLTAVRRGLRPVSDIALPGVMNVRIAKFRLDGDVKDHDVKLHLHRGRLLEAQQIVSGESEVYRG